MLLSRAVSYRCGPVPHFIIKVNKYTATHSQTVVSQVIFQLPVSSNNQSTSPLVVTSPGAILHLLMNMLWRELIAIVKTNYLFHVCLFSGCQVKALQEFHRTPGEQVFAIMQKLVPRADVEAKFNALLPVRNHGDVYHAFISYRCVLA